MQATRIMKILGIIYFFITRLLYFVFMLSFIIVTVTEKILQSLNSWSRNVY